MGRDRRRGEYAAYMASPAWRKKVIWWKTVYCGRYGSGPTCVVCGTPEIDLHHLDYDRLGDEAFDDLIPLCRTHHQAVHEVWDASPQWRRLGRRQATFGLIASLKA